MAKNRYAVLLGRRGGLKGGPARAAKLTKDQLSEIGRKAAQARWAKQAPPRQVELIARTAQSSPAGRAR